MSLSRMALALCCTLLVAAPLRADDVGEANKALVRRFTEEVYNQRSKDRIDAYVHPDFVDHSPGVPPEARGTAWVHQQYENTYGAFPDLTFTLEDVLAEGDKVVMRWNSKGTFRGKLGDVPGRGQSVEVHGISIFRIQDGKIIESWDLVDRLTMLRQAGFTLTPPKALPDTETPNPSKGD